MSFWPVTKKVIKDSDIILLIGDVRMPELSRNKTLENMIVNYGKVCINVFTKIDLVSDKYLNFVKENYKGCFFVSNSKNIGISELRRHLLIMAKRMKLENPKIGVVGYPNVGKSAIINVLARRARAPVSQKAGTTRGIQWIKVGGLLILDSPGVIPFYDGELDLGVMGAKNPEKIKDIEKIAWEIIKTFIEYDKNILEKTYGIIINDNNKDYLLEEIGKKKGFLLKGARVDERRAAYLIVKDWHLGKLRF